MKPLLAHVYEPHRVTYPCYVQPKLNGIRALYQNGHFQSREEIPFTDGLLDHLTKPLLEIFSPDVILDGELYVHGWPLQRILGAVTPNRKEQREDTKLVEYHVFDVVDFTKSFEDRYYSSQQSKTVSKLCFVRTAYVANSEVADDTYAYYVELGYEGMMYRLGDCPYTIPKQLGRTGRTKFLSDKNNRIWHLLKRKNWQDDEFEIFSFRTTLGEKGERGFQLTCRSNSETKPTFDVGSGLTSAEVDHYLENSPVGREAKIKYLVLSSDNIPLNPTILAIL